jgi:hypothetical protein
VSGLAEDAGGDLVDPNLRIPIVTLTAPAFEPRFLADKYACGLFLRDTDFRIGGIDFEATGRSP